jgi:signal transduction histidine kinase
MTSRSSVAAIVGLLEQCSPERSLADRLSTFALAAVQGAAAKWARVALFDATQRQMAGGLNQSPADAIVCSVVYDAATQRFSVVDLETAKSLPNGVRFPWISGPREFGELVLAETPDASGLEVCQLLQQLARLIFLADAERAAEKIVNPDHAKLEALAEFAAGAGHEINNPLATIIGRAQQLLKDEKHQQRRQWLTTIGAQAYRVRDMIGDVMLFARPPKPRLAPVDLSRLVQQVAAKDEAEIRLAGSDLRLDCLLPVWVDGDETQLSVVLHELLRNSRQAQSENGGTITVSVTSIGEKAILEVADEGAGLSDKDRVHLFDPFYSGRQAGRGLGFGLSKVYRIVQAHQGTIAAICRPEKGLVLHIELPRISG